MPNNSLTEGAKPRRKRAPAAAAAEEGGEAEAEGSEAGDEDGAVGSEDEEDEEGEADYDYDSDETGELESGRCVVCCAVVWASGREVGCAEGHVGQGRRGTPTILHHTCTVS